MNWRSWVVGAIALGGLGYYVHDLLSLESSYAVVAAPRQVLVAPNAGRFQHALSLGRGAAVIAPGTQLAAIVPERHVDDTLRALDVEAKTLRAEALSLESGLQPESELVLAAHSQQSQLQYKRVQQLQGTKQRDQSNYELRRAELDSAQTRFEKATPLCENGLKSTLECEQLRSAVQIAERQVAVAESELELAAIALQAAQRGADVTHEGASQLVYRKQREDQLRLRLADLQRDLGLRHARVGMLEAALNSEPLAIQANDPMLLWGVLKPTETLVTQGEPLLEVANCTDIVVYAEFPPAKYERLFIGAEVSIDVRGERYPGRVARLLGPVTSAEGSAYVLPRPPRRNIVTEALDKGTVLVKSDELTKAVSAGCTLGTDVTVHVDDPSLSIFPSFWQSVVSRGG